jgi:hypothetical protein
MPRKKVYLKWMLRTASDTSSISSDDISISDVMDDVRTQMNEIERASQTITEQLSQLYSRAKEESTDWLTEPLIPKPALSAWLQERGLPNRISIDEFLNACYSSAKFMDLDSRVITFHKVDANAIWNGQRRMTVFDIISTIPTLFE